MEGQFAVFHLLIASERFSSYRRSTEPRNSCLAAADIKDRASTHATYEALANRHPCEFFSNLPQVPRQPVKGARETLVQGVEQGIKQLPLLLGRADRIGKQGERGLSKLFA
jgi:hypothetical protein